MNIFDLPVHPAADVWPMIGDDELTQLAADISENGLIDPIVVGEVDGKMMLIDGRNRLAACGMVGVEPVVEQLNGHDPVAYILSKNENRRHMKKYQRAMAVAMMLPEGVGRGKKNEVKNLPHLSDGYVKQARRVLAYANKRENNDPMLAKEVLEGDTPLSEAYAKVKEAEKKPVLTKAQRRENVIKEAPDLGNLIRDDLKGLAEAEAALKARKEEDARLLSEKIEVFARCFGGAVTETAGWSYPGSLDKYLEIIDNKELGVMLRGTLLNGRDGIVPILERFIEGTNNIVNFIKQVEKHDGNT